MNRFSFKKHIPTGRFRSFEHEEHDVLLKGIKVGTLSEIRTIGPNKNPDEGKFRVGFKVKKKDLMEDGNMNCPWRWIFLKKKPESGEDARALIRLLNDEIQKQFDLYIEE